MNILNWSSTRNRTNTVNKYIYIYIMYYDVKSDNALYVSYFSRMCMFYTIKECT
jgi:hypothetical protein